MQKIIDVIGAPFSYGGSRAGPSSGPNAFVASGLLTYLESLGHKVSYRSACERTPNQEEILNTQSKVRRGHIRHEESVLKVVQLAAAHVFVAHRLGHTPLVLGGDHSVSLGTLTPYLDDAISGGRKVGLLWLDAHYDAHTPTTSHSAYANGLPLASALGRGKRTFAQYRSFADGKKKRLRFLPDNVLHIGAGERDCEPEETALLTKMGVKVVTMSDICNGGEKVYREALSQFLENVDDVIFSFDLDAMRMEYVPGVSFQRQDGFFPHQAVGIASILRKSGKLRQVEIMEYNPDFEELDLDGSLKTATFVAMFLGHLFGSEE